MPRPLHPLLWRFRLLWMGLLALLGLRSAEWLVGAMRVTLAEAQTQCTVLSEAQLLVSFSDLSGPATITPQSMRNFVCSVIPLVTSGPPAAVQSVTLTGDVTGTGSGNNAIVPSTLATVTSGGTATKVVVNSKGLVISESVVSPSDLPLQNGGVMYPLGDNSGSINTGLYTEIGGFPWSSGNITSMYAGIGSGSMTLTLYSATSQGATLSAVVGCSGIVVSAGGGGAATACTSTPISRGGQIFCSVSSVTSTGTDGYCEPVFTRTGA
jgi:hypothetical protein